MDAGKDQQTSKAIRVHTHVMSLDCSVIRIKLLCQSYERVDYEKCVIDVIIGPDSKEANLEPMAWGLSQCNWACFQLMV